MMRYAKKSSRYFLGVIRATTGTCANGMVTCRQRLRYHGLSPMAAQKVAIDRET